MNKVLLREYKVEILKGGNTEQMKRIFVKRHVGWSTIQLELPIYSYSTISIREGIQYTIVFKQRDIKGLNVVQLISSLHLFTSQCCTIFPFLIDK